MQSALLEPGALTMWGEWNRFTGYSTRWWKLVKLMGVNDKCITNSQFLTLYQELTSNIY